MTMACDPSGTTWLFAGDRVEDIIAVANHMGLRSIHINRIGTDPDKLRGIEGIYRNPKSRYRLVIVPSDTWAPNDRYKEICRATGLRWS